MLCSHTGLSCGGFGIGNTSEKGGVTLGRPLNRLTGATYSTGESFAYAYDEVGNRTALTTTAGSTQYTYDEANRLTSVDGVTYTWDARGNLTHDGTFTYTYNQVLGTKKKYVSPAEMADEIRSGVLSSPLDYVDGTLLSPVRNWAADHLMWMWTP